jgi:asparagine synthase (glutamine-hydrolysing)
MCGIAGIIGHFSARNKIELVLHSQHHRGPDYTGIWRDAHICLGHNRLSIIDLSDAANQPMTDASGRYVMVFNGEIYNYKELRQKYLAGEPFKSPGDSEVLLALYVKMGAAVLHELIGMFAFAIWDTVEQKLFAARDCFGVKPFYYAQQDDNFLFASELRSLWAAGIVRKPRADIWSAYFNTGSYGMPADTFWESMYQLPAGHFMHYSQPSGLQIEQWYDFTAAVATQNIFENEDELHHAYLDLLKDAVAMRFRADVPVGFTLSGGLDSSLLLAAIHYLFPRNEAIKAFTFYSGNALYDELPWAQKLVARTSKPLEPVKLDKDDVIPLCEEMSSMQAEPFGAIPTVAYHQVFVQAKKEGFKVLLDGQGMDEAWAGYDYYYSGSNHLVQGSVSSPVKNIVVDPAFALVQQDVVIDKPFSSTLQNLQYRDLFFTKLPRALRFNDRASMLASVELREPFLDHRLVEMAFAQTDSMKSRNGQPKWMLRRIAAEWLGNDLAFAPKRPVQTPQREWLRNELKEWANEQINWLATTGNPGWFNGKKMMQEWQSFQQGEGDNSFFVWQWINTALLLRNDVS